MVGHSNRFASLRRSSTVLAAIGVFLVVALFLSFMMAHVVFVMRDTANDIDNARAVDAARAAVASVERRLVGTIRDNAVWDEAFNALEGADSQAWILKNWGSISADYPLYDGVAVTDADGRQIAGYLKGEQADLAAEFGPDFTAQVRAAVDSAENGLAGKFRLGDRVVIAGSETVHPEQGAPAGAPLKVLTMFKIVTPEMLQQIATDYQLEGLRFVLDHDNAASAGVLSLAFHGPDKAPIGYLVWPGRMPGSRLYAEVKPILLDALLVFLLLLSAVLLAGYSEFRALRRIAAASDHDATHDSLSGLLNRSGLIRGLQARLSTDENPGPIALYLIDLDGFKTVNDTWGHAVGDELIRAVATRLSDCHPSLALAARLGGDEFSLASELDVEPQDVARAALSVLSEPFQIGGRTIEIGASIGYVVSTPGVEVLELLRRADMALYRVKDRGRGHALAYSRDLDVEREQISTTEADLRRALDNRQIAVVFQPVVSCLTGRLNGVEALARWNGPNGQIQPGTFIPMAEKAGLINRLGKYVLQDAIRFASARPGIDISVNVSPMQLCHPDFAQEVIEVLDQEAFDPRRLILEVTEGVLIDSPDQARRSIEALRARGIRFSLDDFGIGYASIGALRQFGFDRMKIDRSLVWATENEGGRHVLSATISLAKALNIPVTAEGVETTSQVEVVRQTGCDQMQGYLLGKPMKAEDFDAFMQGLAGAA